MTEQFNAKESEAGLRRLAVEATCETESSLQEQLLTARQEIQDLESLGHRLALDLECLILATDLPASTKWWNESMESLETWREYHNAKRKDV